MGEARGLQWKDIDWDQKVLSVKNFVIYINCIISIIFIMLSNSFVEGGFGAALIQKKNPTQTDYSTVFYWNVFLSVVLYGILFIGSPFIADFFNNNSLCTILRVQALILIPNSLSVVHANILRKQLQFKVLARMYLIPAFLGSSCGVVMAYS